MIYELVIRSTKRFSFIPHDLRYFQDHFICEPMAADWEIPPVEVSGKSYKSADFVLWMLRAPIVSCRAKEAVESLCSGSVEFLPFHPIKGAKHFAVNVLSLESTSPIFKSDPHSVIFVNHDFGNLLRDYSLSGVALADPGDDIGRKIVWGEEINAFPGLVG